MPVPARHQARQLARYLRAERPGYLKEVFRHVHCGPGPPADVGDGGLSVGEHLADIGGPALPVRVQVVDALEVAQQVLAAVLHPGELGIELGPAGVVVADQDPVVGRP